MIDITDVLRFIPNDEIDLTINEDQPFPQYELEIVWKEWRWNNAGTCRLDDTVLEGVTVNPVSYSDESGNLNETLMLSDCVDAIMRTLNNEERVGNIELIA